MSDQQIGIQWKGDSFDKLKQKHIYNFNQNNYSDYDQKKVYIISNAH